MRKFGFIVDLSDSNQYKRDVFVKAFELFSKDLTPKHLKNTHCRIVTPTGEELTNAERIFVGPLEAHEFEESSWLTDWLYFIPSFTFKKWLSYSAMIGPGPVLSHDGAIELNTNITIPCFADGGKNLEEALADCLTAIYHDEGARRIFSKYARRLMADELQKNKVLNTIKS